MEKGTDSTQIVKMIMQGSINLISLVRCDRRGCWKHGRRNKTQHKRNKKANKTYKKRAGFGF